MLAPHDTAPLDTLLTDENGTTFTLRDSLGTWLVVYFYPKDNTPGCTLEAEGFRDMQHEFEKLNTRILGVSKDTCISHRKFIEKKKLPFTLVADENHALMEAFGTWGKRSFMGKTYMGTSRSTFLINPVGEIAYVWDLVKPLGHPKEVLDVLRKLQSV
jgi:peroxiredoxin Q/BCP